MAITALDYIMTDIWRDETGQDFMNVYYVRHLTGTQSASDLIGAFKQTVGAALENILTDNMTQAITSARNLQSFTDFALAPGSLAGLLAGSPLPNFLAVNFPILRSDLQFRNSAKRYGRIAETDVDGNEVAAGAATRFDALATALMADWDNGVSTWNLMMPRRVKTVNPNPPPSHTYVLTDLSRPDGIGQYKPSTQNSRKR